MSLISLEFAGRLVNGIAAPLAACLSLQYKLPQDEIYQQTEGKVLLLGTAGVSFWAGVKLAQKTEEYFKERIDHSKKSSGAHNFFGKDDKKIVSLCTSLAVGAFFYALNIPRVNQVFERYAPYYASLCIRGVGFGYMTLHTIRALDALFHRDVT
jgi:hypothetical protein